MSVTASFSDADVRPAGFWVRLMAYVVDNFILFVIPAGAGFAAGVALATTEATEVTVRGVEAIVQIASVVFAFFYVIGFVAAKGATPGKMALGLRIVREDGGERVGWGTAILREFIGKLVSALVFLIGYLMVGFRADKRGLHDLIAKTSVVKV